MNGKKAKAIRLNVGYNPNVQRTTEESYVVVDKSELLGMVQSGVNPDGTAKYEQLVVNKCQVSLHQDHVRAIYQKSKVNSKGGIV